MENRCVKYARGNAERVNCFCKWGAGHARYLKWNRWLAASNTNSTWNTDMLGIVLLTATFKKRPLVSCAWWARIQSCHLSSTSCFATVHTLKSRRGICYHSLQNFWLKLPSETKRNLEEVKKFHILIPIAKELKIHICALNFSRNDPTISIFLAHFYLL